MKIIKEIGKGLLYLILSPIIIVLFSLFVVYLVFVYFYQFILFIINFFKGEKFSLDTEKDIEARQIIANLNNKSKENESVTPSSNISTTNTSNTTNNDSRVVNNYFYSATPQDMQKILNQQISTPPLETIESSNDIDLIDKQIETEKRLDTLYIPQQNSDKEEDK